MRLGIGLAALAGLMMVAAAVSGQPEGPGLPVKRVKEVTPKDNVFAGAVWNKPIVLRSETEAGKYFDEAAVAALKKQVDFKRQIVVIFAWQGSGQDRLDIAIAESFPEQVSFALQPGKTRDLRTHLEIYALRSNVKWSTRAARP